MIVLARGLTVNDVFARADDSVATGRAARADAFGSFQKPNAHLETKIRRCQRPDRTKIDSVERIIVFQSLSGMRGQHGVTAAIDKSEDIVLRDFVAKPNATRTENAAFVVERDARPELHRFWFLDFVLEKARTGCAVLNAEFLELALAGLIADRAVEGVVDEQKFRDDFAAFLPHRR